jgi:hypothetical protein
VLTGRYHLTPPLSSNPLVREYPNITATFNAVIARTDPVGFVAMSAICSEGHFPTQGNGTGALAYFAIESTNTTPPQLVNNYNPLTQGGIAVKNPNGRTPPRTSWAFVCSDGSTQPPKLTNGYAQKYCSAP